MREVSERRTRCQALVGFFALGCLVFSSVCASVGAENGPQQPPPLPADPTAAWEQVQGAMGSLMRPPAWQGQKPKPEELAQFQREVIAAANTFDVQAREFLKRFPTNENAGDARLTIVLARGFAVAAGDEASEAAVKKFVEETLADPSIPEDERAKTFVMSGNIEVMKKAGTRFFVEGHQKFTEEMDRAGIETLREAEKRFPTNNFVFTFVLGIAQRSKPDVQKQLADEILSAAGASPAAKASAQHLKDGTKPYEAGKPLDIRFTALDGRQIDLTKMKGKVVLVVFWSTECGPCVAETPELKSLYQKYHERGFEVVGISLDDKEGALRRFIKEKELPWPQFFDGKGWANRFAVQYGIFSIPTMWLVDKQGNLCDPNARFALEASVASLLGAN